MNSILLQALAGAALLSLQACAPTIPVTPARLSQPAASAHSEIRLSSPVEVSLAPGFRRSLRQGSRWLLVGGLPEGNVYGPAEGVLTIEGRQVHEARLVVAGHKLVGFYLPAEGGYSPLSDPIFLPFEGNNR